ncbi:MAG: MATE family efflux transporter [Lachnospiraceae bacterium]|nr:MATE family efflux transporter [Lachnospiraceae bacterium]
MFSLRKKKTKYEMDMCSGSIMKKMLLFTVPLMFSSILQLLFNAADVVVVGRFAGDNSLAAVGSTSSLINLLVNLFVGLSVGANVLVAHYYGAKEFNDLKKAVHTVITISIISGIIMTVIGVVGARQFLVWMDTPDKVLDLATTYLRIYFAGMVANMVYNFGAAILRAVGDTKRPLYYLMFSGVVNVVLNLIFVIKLDMDVAGVALATVISQCISAVLVIRCLIKETGGIHLDLRCLGIDKGNFIKILQVGLPAGFQGMLFSLSNVVIQSSVNGFGETIVAGNSAAANIEGFVYVAMNAFHQAAISFTSQNVGAGRYDRINKILYTAQTYVFLVGLGLSMIVIALGEPLLGLYTNSPAVVDAGLVRLKYIVSLYFLCGMMDTMVGSLRGLGYAIMPMIVSLIGACGLRLVWIATVFQMPEFHSIEMIYITYPVSWFLTLMAHVICFIIVRRKLPKERTL